MAKCAISFGGVQVSVPQRGHRLPGSMQPPRSSLRWPLIRPSFFVDRNGRRVQFLGVDKPIWRVIVDVHYAGKHCIFSKQEGDSGEDTQTMVELTPSSQPPTYPYSAVFWPAGIAATSIVPNLERNTPPPSTTPIYASQMRPVHTAQLNHEYMLMETQRQESANRLASMKKAKETVVVHAWSVEDEAPIVRSFQDGFTWPYFSLSIDIISQLSLSESATATKPAEVRYGNVYVG